MKILFTIKADGFLACAEVEEVLKNAKLRYEVAEIKVKNKTSKPNAVHRAEVNLQQAYAIIEMKKKHPKWTNREIGDTQGIGDEVARKIMKGSHPICKRMVD